LNGTDVLAAAAICGAFLRQFVNTDWSVPVPYLDWNVSEVVAHVAIGNLWYAFDLTAGGYELHSLDLRTQKDATPADLVRTLEAVAAIVAYTVDAAPPDSRGFHPFGSADPSGFAAMACDETLVHTYDAACGIGVSFIAEDSLCEKVLRRLFPWAPSETDAWDTLLWANGRVPLGNRARLAPGWRWHCAPLDEWDGTDPVPLSPTR
jgi:uncharacterized protein (TIGR03083 family)